MTPYSNVLPIRKIVLGITFFILSAYILVQNAWLSDDAFISFRVIDNFINGYGLRWNVHERVQVYTHPLWLFLTLGVSLIFGNIILVAFGLNLACSGLALGIGAKFLSKINIWLIPAFILITLSSKAFVDYTSSGLENSLLFLLLILFYTRFIDLTKDHTPASVQQSCLLTGLIYLTRPDAVLLVLGPLAWILYNSRLEGSRGVLRQVFIGFLPAILWTLFSLFYYGFPFPNTAYAKLGTGLPRHDLIAQGFYYILNSLRWDPITLFVIFFNLILCLYHGSWKYRLTGLSVIASLIYVIWIGGDFMSGRFLSAAFFISSYALVRLLAFYPFSSPGRIGLIGLAGFGLIAFALPQAPLRTKPVLYDLGRDKHGICDERGHYARATGLIRYLSRDQQIRLRTFQAGLAQRGKKDRVIKGIAIGMFGYAAGPTKTIIDSYALADALLARLPAETDKKWRIGHFTRRLPAGYEESLSLNQNLITHPGLRKYYEKLKLVTEGPLFSAERLDAIVGFQIKRYDSWLKSYIINPR